LPVATHGQDGRATIAKHGRMAPPSGNALAAEEPHQGQFRLLVSATTDARHHLRPLGFGENVGYWKLDRSNSLVAAISHRHFWCYWAFLCVHHHETTKTKW